MEKFMRSLYRALCDTSLVFSAVVIFFAMLLNPVLDAETGVAVTRDAALTKNVIFGFLGFCSVFGLSYFVNLIKMPKILVHILRFVITGVGFLLIVPKTTALAANGLFVGFFVFTIIYWIAFALIALINFLMRLASEKK